MTVKSFLLLSVALFGFDGIAYPQEKTGIGSDEKPNLLWINPLLEIYNSEDR